MIKNITLKIANITCQQCMGAIRNSIKRLPGIVSLEVNNEIDPLRVEVSYESGKVSFEKIREAVVELGYNVTGYIIHEHIHSHGDITHSHSHRHDKEDDGHLHPHG